MSIPTDIKVPPVAAAQEAAALKRKNALEGVRGEGAFGGLLKKALSLNGQKSSPLQTAAQVGKGEAENLLKRMQAHMNARPWLALVDDGADTPSMKESSEPTLLSLLKQQLRSSDPETEASKLRQAIQNNVGGPTLKDIDRIVDLASRTYGLDADLIRRVIRTESNFNPNSRSPKGAMGLMQLMPETARELGVKDPYNPVDNVMAGTRYLRGLIDRYQGDLPRALAAYNWGMGNVEKNPGRLPSETRQYVSKITQSRRKS